jgi:SP family sugar:H+ symporter-like MFS transporter
MVLTLSARWLLYRGRDEKAEKALNMIHGQALHSEMIVQEQLAILNKSREEEAASSSSQSKWSDLWSMSTKYLSCLDTDLIENPVERRKLIATVGILVSQQISGVQFIFSYTTTFFELVGLDDTFIITVSPQLLY